MCPAVKVTAAVGKCAMISLKFFVHVLSLLCGLCGGNHIDLLRNFLFISWFTDPPTQIFAF